LGSKYDTLLHCSAGLACQLWTCLQYRARATLIRRRGGRVKRKLYEISPFLLWVSALVQVGDRIAAACCTHLNPGRSGRAIKFWRLLSVADIFLQIPSMSVTSESGSYNCALPYIFDHSWIWGDPTILVLAEVVPLVRAPPRPQVEKRPIKPRSLLIIFINCIDSRAVPARGAEPAWTQTPNSITQVYTLQTKEIDRMTFTSQANDPPARLPKLPVNQTSAHSHSWPVYALF
jgi:hypothetical protein